MAKTAIVTGSSRGIGRAIAEKLGSQGFNVVVNYVGNKAEADKVAAAVVIPPEEIKEEDQGTLLQ